MFIIERKRKMTQSLREKITTEWKVKISNHLYLSESRDNVAIESITENGMVLKPRKAWGSQGMKFPTQTFTWDGDLEVVGNKVHVYTTHKGLTSRTRPGQRECVATYTFIPPVSR